MRIPHSIAVVLAAATAPVLFGHDAARSGAVASPNLVIGPRAIQVIAPDSTYSPFTCQLPGASLDCYDPSQIRRAYNIERLLDEGFNGAGKTIVIIDAFQSPNIISQLKTFNSTFGLPGLNGLGAASDRSLGTFTQIAPNGLPPFDPTNADMASWAGEISLDVEWAHAIAPKANIVLLLAKSDADPDILSAQQYAIDNRLGDVISQSFGENESCADPTIVTQTHQAFVQATLKNITLFASSGDDGAAQLTCDGTSFVKAVSHPAVDPLVTAVGATKLLAAPYCLASAGCNPAKNPPPGTYEGEVVWNDQFGSSGGGYSLLYKEPFFQLGSVQGGKRGVPDVSYNGAVTSGVLVYLDTPGLQAGFYIFGGTSAGSPQWAALLAISDQRAGYDVGFINQGLYLLRDNRALYKDSFFDITSGNNTFDGASGFNAAPGWDPTTGLGSPNGIDFVDHLLQSVSPLDGLIGITEAGPLTGAFKSGLGRQRPH